MLRELNLNVYVSNFIDPEISFKKFNKKMGHLAELIFHLSQIDCHSINFNLFTNSTRKTFDGVTRILKTRSNTRDQTNIYTYSKSDLIMNGIYNPWLLTWKHKEALLNSINKGDDNSLYLYLEDDAIFTKSNLEYYLKYDQVLSEIGLIPGYLRAEWSRFHQEWIHSDSFSRIFETCFSVNSHKEDILFLQFPNPYSANFLLNQREAKEYANSESFNILSAGSKHEVIWDTGATAALGLIAENVPPGMLNRLAIPYSKLAQLPVPGSIVRHQGDRYANDKWWKQYRLLDSQELSELTRIEKNFLDYVKKIMELGIIKSCKSIFGKII